MRGISRNTNVPTAIAVVLLISVCTCGRLCHFYITGNRGLLRIVGSGKCNRPVANIEYLTGKESRLHVLRHHAEDTVDCNAFVQNLFHRTDAAFYSFGVKGRVAVFVQNVSVISPDMLHRTAG